MARKPFTTWTVKDVDYKLKLTTANVASLEEKFKCNLLGIITQGENLPPLSIMLTITHEAMSKYNHGIKRDDVNTIFDDYIDEGGSQSAFMTDVLMPIYTVSGFFPESLEETMETKLGEAKEKLGTN